MTETTIQAALVATLNASGLFAEYSVLINDYVTPQTTSRARAPWAIIALADDVLATPGASWTNPATAYGVNLTLLDYRAGRSDKEVLDAFQTLRQGAIAALLAMPTRIESVRANTLLGPYFNEEGEPDPDSIAQRFTVQLTDYF